MFDCYSHDSLDYTMPHKWIKFSIADMTNFQLILVNKTFGRSQISCLSIITVTIKVPAQMPSSLSGTPRVSLLWFSKQGK